MPALLRFAVAAAFLIGLICIGAAFPPNAVLMSTPCDSFTRLLLHFDGTNGSTTFTNSAPSSHAVTLNAGTVALSTAAPKFGTADASFSAAGSSLTTPNSVDFSFGAGNWTVDYWMQPPAAGGGNTAGTDTFGAGANGWHLGSNATAPFFQAFASNSTIASYTAAVSITAATWNHLAFVRNGTSMLFFLNGVSQTFTAATAIGSASIPDNGQPLLIGTAATFTPVPLLDEFRISKGIARWTANFTPPTRQYCQ